MSSSVRDVVLETLGDMDPQWPVPPELDSEGMRAALRAD